MDWVSTGLAAVKIGSSLVGANSAEKAAKKAYKAQAALTDVKRKEEIRQAENAASAQMGTARAAIGASNIQFGGSAGKYLESLDYQNMREIAYMDFARRKEQEAIRAGAQGAGDALRAQAVGDLVGYAAGELIRNSGAISDAVFGPSSDKIAQDDWNDFSGGSAWDESIP